MSRNLLTRLRSSIGSLFQVKESPRELQERQDLYKAILAMYYRNIRDEKISTLDNILPQSQQKALRYSNTHYKKGTKEQLGQLIEHVENKLDSEMEIYRTSIVGLRYELQNLLIPQILHLFKNFSSVDMGLNSNQNIKEECRYILEKELDQLEATLHEHLTEFKVDQVQLVQLDSLKALHHKSQELFLKKKIQAIQTIFDHYDWKYPRGKYLSVQTYSTEDSTIDPFGYNPNSDLERVPAMRHHQMLNLTKSTLLHQKIGYSVLALQSTVPAGGRGIYLNGFASAGSLVAFFPGQVWPKEYLLSNSESILSLFKDDPNHMLSLRYDDILIDSRKAPYTVLSHENSNPFCIAHIANHPPKFTHTMDSLITDPSPSIVPPNCHTVMLNFTQGMNLEDQGLSQYLPNTYARSPQLLGPQMFDREAVSLHGMGLLASRDICDEELFYDYRLSPTKDDYPHWYTVLDETDLRNRWFHDKDK